MTAIIPHDVLLHQILPKLPTKSIARFMCVSKELHLFLSSETFKKMHKKMHIHHDKFLLLINDYKEPRTLGSIDCEAPDDVLFFKLPIKTKSVSFLTSFDGLVCVSIPIKRITWTDDLILWNPLTSDWKTLSDQPKEDHYYGSLGLFYSSCEDDYKLVSVSCYNNNVYMYSLKSDSWKKVAFKGISNLQRYRLLTQGTCLNENIYFLNNKERHSVVRFDTKTETFTEMKTFNLNDNADHCRAFLMVKNGCIHVCITYESYVGMVSFVIEFWKIDEEGNCKKMETYRVDSGYMRFMEPLHLTSNGNLLMRGNKFEKFASEGNNLYNVDLKKKHSKGKGKDKETRCSDMQICDMVSMIGVHFEDDHVATGFGNHLARPILCEEWRDDLTSEEGIANITEEGLTISQPYSLKTFWNYAAFQSPTTGAVCSPRWFS